MQQAQFLNVIDRDEAERRFHSELDLRPLEAEEISLEQALQRVLARDVIAPIDVPSFDRSNVDGFAVRAQDTFGASDQDPKTLILNAATLKTGALPIQTLGARTAMAIATGATVPRGADAVIMIEHTDVRGTCLSVRQPMAPGANITYAGTDIGCGETVLRRGELLTSRETGVIAALGLATIDVCRQPRVAILSTGDEIIAPGAEMRPGLVFDSNSTVLADATRELGGKPICLGIVPDDQAALAGQLREALVHDVVLLSGGTSKGEGDLSYRVLETFGSPGILVHGVALKPGKPLCLAVFKREGGRRNIPVVILPGFPTSAIFSFREFVVPVIRALSGRREEQQDSITARLPARVNSERGRTEYVLVNLVADLDATQGFVAYPMGKGSGSVTAFSRSDGFITIARQTEYLEAGEQVRVHVIGSGVRPVDLVVIGSHCPGVDFLLGQVQERGFQSKFLAVGSSAGLQAAQRGECDVAGIHLLDPISNQYNEPFLDETVALVRGYGRLQGIVYRHGDVRFEGLTPAEATKRGLNDLDCILVNRNRGSGTRILVDDLLQGARPAGYLTEARSHSAVVAAVAQGRADWGVAIEIAARQANLGFLPLIEEQFDFLIPVVRKQRPAVQCFAAVLADRKVRDFLRTLDLRPSPGS